SAGPKVFPNVSFQWNQIAFRRNCGSLGSLGPEPGGRASSTLDTQVEPYTAVNVRSTTDLRPLASPSSSRPIRSLLEMAISVLSLRPATQVVRAEFDEAFTSGRGSSDVAGVTVLSRPEPRLWRRR